MSSWWLSWPEVNTLIKNKRVLLYGRSEDWVPKTLQRLIKQPELIIDRNPIYKNTDYKGIDVVQPEHLTQFNKNDIFIVITSGVYEGIVSTLIDMGFKPGIHFTNSPEYRDYALLEDMRNYQQEIIVSCSDYHDNTKTRYSRAGGGLYRYSIGPNTHEQLVKGSFRQIIDVGEFYYAVEFVELKLYVFDKQFQVVKTHDLDAANYCGIDYDPGRNLLIIINASHDSISRYRVEDFILVDRFYYNSNKAKDSTTSQHHLNDCCIDGDYLYVSYFSHSGNWKKGIHDGGISEFHLDNLEAGPRPIVSGLWKPHSPKMIQGDLCYLDSMRGHLYTNNQVIAGEFPGFARGLAADERFYYVGQSEDMYMSRRFGTCNNIMLNAGFFMFDIQTKASRFYPMLDNMNIHDLLIPSIL